MRPTLSRALQQASDDKVALGHFNVSELVMLKAASAVARELNVPVIIGVSEGERGFLGVRQIAALVASLRDDLGLSMYLNADHTHSLEKLEEAARAGFDSVVFDASKQSFEDNVAQTKRAVEAAKSINPSMVVEGEIGYIGSGSEIHPVAEAPAALTTPEEAQQFAAATGIDVLAPAVGSTHGMLPSMIAGESHQHLDVARIAAIKAATGLPLTLHGGSGSDDDDLRRAIRAGITVIHISTELRVAWRRGLESTLASHPDEVAPYELFSDATAQVTDVIRSRLSLFSSSSQGPRLVGSRRPVPPGEPGE
jgi:fructose-bisphosphate aldolase class II